MPAQNPPSDDAVNPSDDSKNIPLEPTVSASDPRVQSVREEELKRAAEMGRRRAEQEKAVKEKIRKRREDEQLKGQAVARQFAEHREEAREKKKIYRKTIQERNKQLAAEKARAEKEAALKKAAAEKAEEGTKEKMAYMKDLQEQGVLKEAIRVRRYNLKLEFEAGRKKSEFDRRSKVEQAQLKYRTRVQELEREERARKEIFKNETQKELYQLETWRRMKSAATDSESAMKRAALRGRNVLETDRQSIEIENAARIKKKRLENEYKERKEQIEANERLKSNKYENDVKDLRTKNLSDLNGAAQAADWELKRKLDELQTKYDAQIRGRKG